MAVSRVLWMRLTFSVVTEAGVWSTARTPYPPVRTSVRLAATRLCYSRTSEAAAHKRAWTAMTTELLVHPEKSALDYMDQSFFAQLCALFLADVLPMGSLHVYHPYPRESKQML